MKREREREPVYVCVWVCVCVCVRACTFAGGPATLQHMKGCCWLLYVFEVSL